MKTYGDLRDAMQRLREANTAVVEAERRLAFGGAPETWLKRERELDLARQRLADLLKEEL